MRVGAIDCGTNSIRLLIADVQATETGPALIDRERHMKIVRLGKGVDATGWLAKESLERTFAATRDYAQLLDEYGVTDVRFAATSATRDAGNRQIFIDGIRNILGVEPEVITGHEEAELSFAGAVSSVGNTDEMTLVIDLGGGSTEFVLGNKDGVAAARSVDIGCVRMTERHISSDPANVTQVSRVIADTDRAIATALGSVDLAAARRVVGVAGTVTTVAAHALGLNSYDPEKIDRSEISIKDISRAAADMVSMTGNQRAALPYMHEGRVDIIPAGSVVWARICERISALTGGTVTTAIASEKDILDGLALSVAERTTR
ncbi:MULTISPECIES: Ppx/GppA phosphatase family protein [Rothia]|uniref:Exopolyphosphatase n=1 Tax=Rothia nasimurium TaxID=85336 RepID=A0A1Y1RLU2_9MICC|nr:MULTISPECIES: Ppx/GppA phosphatase family protein [Rothia]ORC15404.1 exopolyphosphatase [Rothia nasimurium]